MNSQIDDGKPLLDPLECVAVPAMTAAIPIRDYFKKNTSARISTVFAEFKSRFFDKTEPPYPEVSYRKYKLLRISPDNPIIAELGGEAKVEGAFGAAFALIQRQPRGELGFLQTNGYANIFYAKDKMNELCAIRIGWAADGWVIDAISVRDPLAWNGKHEIFCPA